jgi:hypothetical protein
MFHFFVVCDVRAVAKKGTPQCSTVAKTNKWLAIQKSRVTPKTAFYRSGNR